MSHQEIQGESIRFVREFGTTDAEFGQCDGVRPTCARCQRAGMDCLYDIAIQGVTRMQGLQQQLRSRTDDYDRLVALFSRFQYSTDEEASMLLARVRTGESIETLMPSMSLVQQPQSE